jgi:hypothetical protein
LIEDVFRVTEYAFDACRLRLRLEAELAQAGVEVCRQAEVQRVSAQPDGHLELMGSTHTGEFRLRAGQAFNCTYAHLNHVLAGSGLPAVPLKQELTEMALVEVPDVLRHVGVTVMCGPFFSIMPFPARGLHTLSHVRYTPHEAWHEGAGPYQSAYARMLAAERQTSFPYMMRDAARYLPAVGECRYVDSLWEVKTVLPRSEQDDSRPILFKQHYGLPNFHCVLGAKIDNIFDLLDQMNSLPAQAA